MPLWSMRENIEVQYLDLLRRILNEGELKHNRTGVDTLAIAGAMLEHDMSEGFPLLTSRKLPYKSTKVELEFFIKGLTSKGWLQERGCSYWNAWANPQKVPYGQTDEARAKMVAEDDLGFIYGSQWRDFKDPRVTIPVAPDSEQEICISEGVDQLKSIVETLKKNPDDRRMICSAWNPMALKYAALPSCHFAWQVTVINGKLNLAWSQRSVDTFLGLPANISSYATLLHLLAKEAGLKEGKLIGFLMDTHLYVNHVDQCREQLTRKPFQLPQIQTKNFTSIFDWQYGDTELLNYTAHPALRGEVAV